MPRTHALDEHMIFNPKSPMPEVESREPLLRDYAKDLDTRIETSAKNSFNFKTYLKDDKIKVESFDGIVTLTGTVFQNYHKTLAQETVAVLAGVTSVNNQLEVTGDQPTEQSDGWITLKVKAILTFHKNVHATGTEVHTQNGIVTLSGNADSEAQKQLTGEYAKDVEGVTEVFNKLLISKFSPPLHETLGEKLDDASITAQIKTSLLFHKSTHALAIKVVTKFGVVTLRGEVNSMAEKELVTKLVKDIQDVDFVSNWMDVRKS